MKNCEKPKHLIKIGISLLVALLTIVIGLWLNKIIVHPNYGYLLFAMLKTLSLLLGIVSLLFLSLFVSKLSCKSVINNLIYSSVGILLLFLFFEMVFSFYTPSTSVFTDLSNQIWMKRYNQNINNLGYRDEEPNPDKSKKNVLVIGDSFVAGHGIKYDEMFVNILKTDLQDNFNVFNLGVCGSHTDREFDSLLNYPVSPDVIVLCYYHNDIESAMINYNFFPDIKNPRDNLSNFSKLFVDNSLFINFLFTLSAKKSISSQFMESEQNDIIAYLHQDLWEYQINSLDSFYNYASDNNTEFIIVFFPGLGDGIVFTNELAGKKIEQYCNDRGIEFINIYDEIKNIPLKRRVANSLDHHPSAEVNRIVAEKLQDKIIN
jgi:hypothetical protein